MRSPRSWAFDRATGRSPRAASVLGVVTCAALFLLATADAPTRTAPELPDPSPAAANRADCLWYAARNHGFYPVQREIVRAFAASDAATDAATEAARADGTPSADRVSWNGFVATIGARECGVVQGDVPAVLAALAGTADDADRFFLGEPR